MAREKERERELRKKRQDEQPVQFFSICVGKSEEVEALFAFFVDPSQEDHHKSDEH